MHKKIIVRVVQSCTTQNLIKLYGHQEAYSIKSLLLLAGITHKRQTLILDVKALNNSGDIVINGVEFPDGWFNITSK